MPQPKAAAASERTASQHGFWRGVLWVLASVFLVVAGLAFTLYVVVAWMERQVLSADSWTSYASDLPKNQEVSWALSDKITTQIFENATVDQRIEEALPEKAGFLAGPLSDQLEARSIILTQRAVESDTFQSIWTGANRLAMERFLANARGENDPRSVALGGSINEKFDLDLSGLKPILRDRLGDQAELSSTLQDRSQQAIAISTDLQARREQLWQAVRTVDFIYAILPAVFIVALLGMLAFAADRRKAMITLSAVALGLLLATIIAVKYARQQLLAEVNVAEYQPAVSYIFDSLVMLLRQLLLYGLVLWGAVLVLGILAGPAKWAVRFRRFLHIPELTRSRPAKWWYGVRAFIARYRFALWVGILALALLYLAFVASVSTVVLVNSLLLALGGMLLIQVLSGVNRPIVTPVTAGKTKNG